MQFKKKKQQKTCDPGLIPLVPLFVHFIAESKVTGRLMAKENHMTKRKQQCRWWWVGQTVTKSWTFTWVPHLRPNAHYTGFKMLPLLQVSKCPSMLTYVSKNTLGFIGVLDDEENKI